MQLIKFHGLPDFAHLKAHLKEVGLRGTSHWRSRAHDLDLKYLMGGKGQDFASH